MSLGAQGSARSLLTSGMLKLIWLPPLAPTSGKEENRNEERGVGSRNACLPLGAGALLGCHHRRVQIKFAHRILPTHHRGARGCVSITGALPGLPAGLCARCRDFTHRFASRSALCRAHSPRRSHEQGGITSPPCRSRGLSGCCPLAEGLAGPRGHRGMLGVPQPPAPNGLPGHHPSLWGSFLQDALAQEWAWEQGTVGWAGRQAARVPSPSTPTQISQDTWLVAEIPFISLNCVTSNTAGGRISVDLSYWGWRVQNLAEKIYHARKIIAVVSAIYRREGQRRSVPNLPASGHRAPRNGAGIVGKTRWGTRVARAMLIPSVGCGRVLTVPWQRGP